MNEEREFQKKRESSKRRPVGSASDQHEVPSSAGVVVGITGLLVLFAVKVSFLHSLTGLL